VNGAKTETKSELSLAQISSAVGEAYTQKNYLINKFFIAKEKEEKLNDKK
jgi:hypothetical protein